MRKRGRPFKYAKAEIRAMFDFGHHDKGRLKGWSLTDDKQFKQLTFDERGRGTLQAYELADLWTAIRGYVGNDPVRQRYQWHVQHRNGVWRAFVY